MERVWKKRFAVIYAMGRDIRKGKTTLYHAIAPESSSHY
jgi:hypothetical protein